MDQEKDKYEAELEKAIKVAIALPASLSNEIAILKYVGSMITEEGKINDYYYDHRSDRYYYEPDFAKRWRINKRNKRIKK